MVARRHRRTVVVIGIVGGLMVICANGFGATVALGNATAFPGFGQANMPVSLSLEPGDQVAGAQWDLVFDSNVLNLCAIHAGPAAIIAGKSVSFSTLSPGTVHVLVTGLNVNVIPDGILATVVFSVASGAPGGDREVYLDNVIFAHPYGLDITAEGIPGLLTIDEEALAIGWNTCLGLSVACGCMLVPGIFILRKKRKG